MGLDMETFSVKQGPSSYPERNPGPWGLERTAVCLCSECLYLVIKGHSLGMCLVCLSVESEFPFVLREEDEYSELRSELSQSQHEANEDSHSVDQDQTSVSVPENQSTMVTADMGKSACCCRNARARFLDYNQNFRSMRQPGSRFSESSSLLSR